MPPSIEHLAAVAQKTDAARNHVATAAAQPAATSRGSAGRKRVSTATASQRPPIPAVFRQPLTPPSKRRKIAEAAASRPLPYAARVASRADRAAALASPSFRRPHPPFLSVELPFSRPPPRTRIPRFPVVHPTPLPFTPVLPTAIPSSAVLPTPSPAATTGLPRPTSATPPLPVCVPLTPALRFALAKAAARRVTASLTRPKKPPVARICPGRPRRPWTPATSVDARDVRGRPRRPWTPATAVQSTPAKR